MQEQEVTGIENNENYGMETMTEQEYNELEKEYLEEKDAEKKNAENIEAEKRKAEKTVRFSVQKKIRKGCLPSKAIEEFLCNWMEQRDVMERPTVVKLSHGAAIDNIHTSAIPEYGYYDKSCYAVQAIKWKTKKEKCLGQYQDSPIDIQTGKVKKCKYYRKLSIIGLWNKDKLTTIYNNGDSVKGTISGEAFLSNGPLFGNYQFQQFSLKYGDTKNNGTEHSIDGQRFALEFHLIFSQLRCSEYPARVLKARSNKAVLVVLFEENKERHYYELFSLISHLNKIGKKITVTNNLLYDFKDVLLSPEYYNYVGSSTEKPYIPNVEWFIFKKPQPIHKTQMELLWQLKKTGSLKPTLRPMQPVGERVVFEPSYKYHYKCRGKPICEC